MNKHTLQISRTARYYTLGTISPKINTLVFVIHGYAQSAHEFLESFKPYSSDSILFIAPEGLSRFYLNHSKVVASWMTKEERLSDINEYCNFISQVRNQILEKLQQEVKEHVIGFSQGSATASRWVCNANISPENVIFIGGIGAHDVDWKKLSVKNKTIPVYLGSKDRFYKEKNKEELLNPINKLAAPYVLKHISYVGGHHPTTELLDEIFNFL